MVVYKITNKLNGMCYIGATTTSSRERFRDHCNPNRESKGIVEAIQKYGKENFYVEDLIKCGTLEELHDTEEYYIDFYNSVDPNGYNRIGINHKQSAETIKRRSFAMLGKSVSPETRLKMSKSASNRKKS
jgi:group I intron endonuclease